MFEQIYDEMITIDDLTSILSIGRNNAYRLLNSGEISGAFRIGRCWKIPREAVSDYILSKMNHKK